jgi:NADH:ubiquinone oxidoreductase subunit H
MLPSICLLSGLAGLWACGDFAITGFFVESGGVQTLAFQMKEVLSQYRSDQAVDFLWPLLLCGAVVFIVFQGLSYVSGQKTQA